MTYSVPDIAWASLTPILIVLGAAALGVLLEAFVRAPAERRVYQLQLSLVAVVASLVAVVWRWVALEGDGIVVLKSMILLDRQALAWQFLLLLFALGSILLFADTGREGEDAFTPLGSVAPGSAEETVARAKGMYLTEAFPLVLFATGGTMLVATIND